MTARGTVARCLRFASGFLGAHPGPADGPIGGLPRASVPPAAQGVQVHVEPPNLRRNAHRRTGGGAPRAGASGLRRRGCAGSPVAACAMQMCTHAARVCDLSDRARARGTHAAGLAARDRYIAASCLHARRSITRVDVAPKIVPAHVLVIETPFGQRQLAGGSASASSSMLLAHAGVASPLCGRYMPVAYSPPGPPGPSHARRQPLRYPPPRFWRHLRQRPLGAELMRELEIEPCDYGRLVPYTMHCDGAPGGKRASFKLLQWAGALPCLGPLRQHAARRRGLRARLSVAAAPPPPLAPRGCLRVASRKPRAPGSN